MEYTIPTETISALTLSDNGKKLNLESNDSQDVTNEIDYQIYATLKHFPDVTTQ